MSVGEVLSGTPVFDPRRSVVTSSNGSLCQATAEHFAVHVSVTVPAIEALAPIWSNWSRNLDTDFEYYRHNLQSDPTILHPYVITASYDGVPQAMLIGRVREGRVSTVVSSLNVHGPRAKVLEVLPGGRIGTRSAAIDKLLASQLRETLQSTDIDLLCLRRLPLESDLFRSLQQIPGFLGRARVPNVFRYSVVPLNPRSGQRAQALSGKNSREIRRKTRIVQRAFPGARFQCFSDLQDLEGALRDVMSIDATTWQRYVGGCELDRPQTLEKLQFCAQKGLLRIYLMYVDNLPVAFLIGQQYRKTFYCQHAGYRPDFARYSVGSLLTAWALELLATAGFEMVDLGEGGQEHNRRLGCKSCPEGTVHVYAPKLRGLCVGVFFAGTLAVRGVGRLARATLRLNRLNRVWRQFLIFRLRPEHYFEQAGKGL
jgi:hypothetical protein